MQSNPKQWRDAPPLLKKYSGEYPHIFTRQANAGLSFITWVPFKRAIAEPGTHVGGHLLHFCLGNNAFYLTSNLL